MMIKKLPLFTFTLLVTSVFAQRSSHATYNVNNGSTGAVAPIVMPTHRNCGTMDYMQQQLQQHPELIQKRQETKNLIQQKVSELEQNPERSNVVHTIPVVVHVVYNGSTQNISDAQIMSQLTVLNNDFRKTNSDFNSIVNTGFGNVGADAQIEFCLAQRDPNNQATTGITRTATSHAAFTQDDDVKYTATGGHDAWDASKYLNLWVCNLGNNLLGYAQFPGGNPTTDGVAILYSAFGTTGTATNPYNKGRTATHEIGHYFELFHIWGDDNGACVSNGGQDDGINDTPEQKDENGGCPIYPLINGAGASCSGTAPGAMFMNYMDYTNDACMYMFTTGQSNVMNAALSTSRSSLLSSNGCIAPGVGPTNPNCDTLVNIPATYTQNLYANYSATTWGYVSGHNSYLDVAKAEKFVQQNSGYQISGCYIKFARISYTNTSSNFNVKIWDDNGVNSLPSTVLGAKNITYASLAADVSGGNFSLIQFTNPIPVSGNFYAGVDFAYAGTDTLAIYTTTIGNVAAGAGTAYEKFDTGVWHNFNETPASWDLDVSLFIAPVMCDSFVGINEVANDFANIIQVFPNPAKDEVSINISDLKSTTINLYNLTGSIVKTLNSNNSNGLAKFNTANLPRGMYLVEVKNASFKTFRKLILE